MSTLLAILLTTALWYLGTRAAITELIWSRYPPRLARFMDCAACAGFWWGIVVYLLLTKICTLSVMGLYSMYTAPLIGLCSLVWTPLVAHLHDQALLRLGSAIAREDGELRPGDDHGAPEGGELPHLGHHDASPDE